MTQESQGKVAPAMCRYCRSPLQGRSEMCVLCYSIAHSPCPDCMVRSGRYRDKWSVRKVNKKEVKCDHCHNERWILDIKCLKKYLRMNGRMPEVE